MPMSNCAATIVAILLIMVAAVASPSIAAQRGAPPAPPPGPPGRPGIMPGTEPLPMAPPADRAATPIETEPRRVVPVHASVLDASGRWMRGEIVAIDADRVELRGQDGMNQSTRWPDCVGVFVEAESARDVEAPAVAMFTDGQRLPGRVEANASGLRWAQRWIGVIDLPQDQIRWVSFDGRPPIAERVDADVIGLRTGDRLEGFVSKLADPLEVEAVEGGTTTSLALERVQSIAFVTGESRPTTSRRRVWLRDGTVIDAGRALLGGNGALSLEDAAAVQGRTVTVPIDAVAAIAGDRTAMPLASQKMRTTESGGSSALRYEITAPERLEWPGLRPRRVVGTAISGSDASAWPVGLPSIAFDGPAALEIELADRARLVGRLLLPKDRQPHGRFVVVVRSGGRELARHTIGPSTPTAELSVDVEPPMASFEIIDAGGGALQDGVVIERAALLMPVAAATQGESVPSAPTRSSGIATPTSP